MKSLIERMIDAVDLYKNSTDKPMAIALNDFAEVERLVDEFNALRQSAVAHAALLKHFKSLPGVGATTWPYPPEVFYSEQAIANLPVS